jgi:hypothetical protein
VQLVPGREPSDLLDLPWDVPIEQWEHPRLVRMARGQSRHVVRFVNDGERVLALKETSAPEAEHEYRMLRELEEERLPAVKATALVTGREAPDGAPLAAVLVTRYLDFSLPFRYLFGLESGGSLGRRLIDAGVVLLARLHLEGFYWGDCSLSNLLFRRDAGALVAYLVDAETAERRVPMPAGMREADLELAKEHVVGGLLDLQAAGRLSPAVDPVVVAELLEQRYEELWQELTAAEEIDAADRHLIDRRIRRLNELGFDVDELVVERAPGGDRLRVYPAVVEEGHHARELQRLTGLTVQENQARRLLADIASFGACLEGTGSEGSPHPQSIVAARWLAEVYEPIVASVPPELRSRREAPELFHELLEHRYYLSEAAGHEVDNATALASYLDNVLRHRPEERVLTDDADHVDEAADPIL